MLAILIVGFLATRGMKDVPGPLQNFMELTFEKLEDWAISLGGEQARRHIPVFTAFFLFILVSNWSGLIPVFGKIEALNIETVRVRSPLTCESPVGVCAKCYGIDLSTGMLEKAARKIGEKGWTRFRLVQASEKSVDGFQFMSTRDMQTRIGVGRLHAALVRGGPRRSGPGGHAFASRRAAAPGR